MGGKQSVKIFKRKNYKEIHIQLVPSPDETPEKFWERIAETVSLHNAVIIRATFFGKLIEEETLLNYLKDKGLKTEFPYSWIEGDNCTDSFINGAYVMAVSGIEVKRLFNDGKVTGTYFHTPDAEFCYLGGLYSNPRLTPSQQTSDILKMAEITLNQAGLSFRHVVRTWFYLDNILEWYNDFNAARTAFFHDHDVYNNLVPASTGIGGKNNASSKVCLELTAIRPESSRFSIAKVMSPLQCPAENYGSSFSRSIRWSDSEYENLTVSGTASINKDGKTMYPGEIDKQIDLSFKVVIAILESREFKFSDITRFYAYCSDKRYSREFYNYINTFVTYKVSFICSENVICRDGLLFEIELDAVRKLKGDR